MSQSNLSMLDNTHVDSDLVKQIKATGLLTSDDIIENENSIITPGSCSINSDYFRESAYKHAYIKKRDESTTRELIDGYSIKFRLTDTNSGIFYKSFINNNHEITGLGLLYENIIALKSSYIKIAYNKPCTSHRASFRINAVDCMDGFTFSELATVAMQYYHLLFDLYSKFDLKSGTMTLNWTDNDKLSNDRCFKPLTSRLEWENNGLDSLKYNKQNNTWEFVCLKDDQI